MFVCAFDKFNLTFELRLRFDIMSLFLCLKAAALGQNLF